MNKKFGYARVSSKNQDLELQEEELKKAGCTEVFSEKISGKDNNRPALKEMLETLREGDTVIIYKVDRIARSLLGLLEIIEELDKKKVDLISLDSNDKVNTTDPMNKAFFQLSGVFAELNRSFIKARTGAGVERALANGVKFGRETGYICKISQSKVEKIKIFLEADKSFAWISKELAVSKSTISKVKKALAEFNSQISKDSQKK